MRKQTGFSLIDDSKRGDLVAIQNVLKDKEEIIILAQYIQESSKRIEANTEKYQEVFAYKKVANWVKPVAMTLPEEFRIIRKIL